MWNFADSTSFTLVKYSYIILKHVTNTQRGMSIIFCTSSKNLCFCDSMRACSYSKYANWLCISFIKQNKENQPRQNDKTLHNIRQIAIYFLTNAGCYKTNRRVFTVSLTSVVCYTTTTSVKLFYLLIL